MQKQKNRSLHESLLELLATIAGIENFTSKENAENNVNTKNKTTEPHSLNYVPGFAVACCGAAARKTLAKALDPNYEVFLLFNILNKKFSV